MMATSKRMELPLAIVTLPDAAVSSQGQASDKKVERATGISKWLVEIGSNPNQYEMATYARKLYDHGFQSVEMIVKWCIKEDIEGLDWINPLHKRWITTALGQDK